MFFCKKCGFEFDSPKKIYEHHSLDTPPFEQLLVCPSCSSDDFKEKKITHCRCCGARMINLDSDYCSEDCREKGEKLYELERKKRQINDECPINDIVRKVEAYNKKNNTNYSYGQFVALILPKLKVNKKCKNSKKNT